MQDHKEQQIATTLLRSLPGIFYMFDETGHFTRWNQQFLDITGYTAEEMDTLHPLDLFRGADKDYIQSRIAQVFQTGRSDAQANFITKEENSIPFYFTGVRLDLERPYLIGVGFDISDRVRAEQEMARSHELLHEALNQSLSGIIIARAPDGCIEMASKAALLLRGGQPEKLTNIEITEHVKRWQTYRPDGSVMQPEDLPLSRAILQGEIIESEEVIIRDEQGLDHLVVANASPVRNEKGDIIAGIVVFHDITEQKKARADLEDQQIRMKAVFNAMQELVFVIDHKGTFLEIPAANPDLLYASPEQVIGKTIADIFDPQKASFFLGKIQDALARQEIVTMQYSLPVPAGLIWFEASINPIDTKRVLMVVRDITERHKVLEETQKSNRELRILNKVMEISTRSRNLTEIMQHSLEAMIEYTGTSDGLICLKGEHNYVAVASSHALDFHLRSEKISAGKCFCDNLEMASLPFVLSEPQAVENSIRQIFSGKEAPAIAAGISSYAVYSMQHQNQELGRLCLFSDNPDIPASNDSDIMQILATQLAIVAENTILFQKVEENVAVLEDRVAERTRELEFLNKEMEAFAYSVSHDLRAPLRAIDGWAMVIQEDHGAELSPEALALFNRQRSATRRMAELIDDVLRLSRLSRQPLLAGEVDIGEIVRNCWEEIEMNFAVPKDENSAKEENTRKGPILILSSMPEKCPGDRALLGHAVRNLLENAAKFSSKNSAPRVEAGGSLTEEEYVFYIRDNGVGFDPRFASRMFQPFQRLHNQQDFPGNGIGLATVQRILERHGGRIWADSQPDQGATFFFSLPRQSNK